MFLWRTDWEAEATITARSKPGTLSVGDGGGFLAFQPGPFRRGMVAHHGGKISHVHLVFPYVKFFFCFCPVCLLFQPRFPRYTVDQVEEGEEAIIPSIASLQLRKERKGMRRETYDLYDEETKCSWGREGRGRRKKKDTLQSRKRTPPTGRLYSGGLVSPNYIHEKNAAACSNLFMRKFKDCFDFRSAFRPASLYHGIAFQALLSAAPLRLL